MLERHRKIVDDLIAQGNDQQGQLYDLACNNAFTGYNEEALRLLNKIPFWWVTYGLARIDPMLDPIREQPEFKKIIQRQHDEMIEFHQTLNMYQFNDDLEWLYR